jgi:hypothetical protein
MPAASGGRSTKNLARRIGARILFASVILADLVLGAYVLRLYYVHARTRESG